MSRRMKNVRVYGLAESIVASGYPMRSEPMSSNEFSNKVNGVKMLLREYGYYLIPKTADEIKQLETICESNKDTKRGIKLGNTKTGEGHDNFLNGIIVQFDLTFSNKAWVDAQRYHFLDFVSSMSTMHRIAKLSMEVCCNDYVDDRIKAIVTEYQEKYNADPTPENYLLLLYNVPSGIEITARMTTNYRQLKTIWRQRYNHRLPDWREFCKEIEELPMFVELTGCGKTE